MSKPADLSKGLEKFFEFHQLEPHKTGKFAANFKIPNTIKCAGEALYVNYQSTKWNGKPTNYTHDHSWGVKVYRPDEGYYVEDVPVTAKKVGTLVRLGYCLGFGYKDRNGDEIEAVTNKPYPDLYCTPDGSILLVVQGKSKLEAMIWGGSLDVKAKGIVG